MNFLITNSVPLNGGDEALLRAAVESLAARWPGCEVTVLCSDPERARAQCPDLRLEPDLELTAQKPRSRAHRTLQRAARRLPPLGSLGRLRRHAEFAGAPPARREVLERYRRADVVISAPGGFLNDHYGLEKRLRGLEVALDWGKPVVLFAQSLGPFWKAASIARIGQVLNRVSRICVRDAVSREHLLQCGVDPSRIRDTADAAFLWRDLAPELSRARSGPPRAIGLSFRVWPLGDMEEVRHTVMKAERLCRFLLADPARTLVFRSTCQGIPGYVDDSELAVRIVEGLPPALQARCRVDRNRYGARALIRALGECDAYIGMRLHGCLLAMLGGTPAMGLGYETKTEEIFGQLGFSEYQVPFRADGAEWLAGAARFLAGWDGIRLALGPALDRLCLKARGSLDAVGELLPGPAGRTPRPVAHAR
jgi:colanic acid/amylovoran biosynthesis protein